MGVSLLCVSVSVCEREGAKREGPPRVIRPSVQPTVNLEPENRGIESGKWVANTKSVWVCVLACVCVCVRSH